MANLMDAAIAAGGSSWTHPRTGERRVYLNASDWGPSVGFDFATYKTGNISSAALRGSYVSNAAASATMGRKVWVDAQGVHVEDGGRKSVVSSQEIKDALTSRLSPAPLAVSAGQGRTSGS